MPEYLTNAYAQQVKESQKHKYTTHISARLRACTVPPAVEPGRQKLGAGSPSWKPFPLVPTLPRGNSLLGRSSVLYANRHHPACKRGHGTLERPETRSHAGAWERGPKDPPPFEVSEVSPAFAWQGDRQETVTTWSRIQEWSEFYRSTDQSARAEVSKHERAHCPTGYQSPRYLGSSPSIPQDRLLYIRTNGWSVFLSHKKSILAPALWAGTTRG